MDINGTVRISFLLQSRTGTALRYIVSLTLLGWLASRIDWTQLATLREIDRPLLLAAVLLAGLAYPLQAWRWHELLRALDLHLPSRWVQVVCWIGLFYNSFLPGGVAGDAVRFGHLWRIRPDRKAAAAASLIADRLLGLGALLVLASLALGLHLSLGTGGGELQLLLSASLAALGFLLAGAWSATRTRWWEPMSQRLLGTERAAALHDAAFALGSRHATLAWAAVLSVGVWLVDFVSLWLLAQSVGLEVGALAMTVAAAAAYVAATLPISIGGHGVREGALVAVLGLLGLGADQPNQVAQLALVFWAVSVGWCIVGGLIGLIARPAAFIPPKSA